MNERIRELVRESNLDVYGLGKERYRWEYTVEKFAKLIVRECAEIADTERPNSLGCGYITKTKSRLIREHFGVEE